LVVLKTIKHFKPCKGELTTGIAIMLKQQEQQHAAKDYGTATGSAEWWVVPRRGGDFTSVH